jgi:CubicO group peptidase (beta-lactamase class C family)
MMQLFERGLFKLDDEVSRYIPSWKNLVVFKSGTAEQFQTCEPQRPMTIRDLLTHTSGLTYFFQNSHPVDEMYRHQGIDAEQASGSLEQKIERLTNIPLQFSPGSRWNYSVSTDVIGYLIQVISDTALDHYIEQNICSPLGLVDTRFQVSSSALERFAACYEYVHEDQSFKLQDDPMSSPYLKPPHFLSGGGGMVSTIDDYHRFASMLLNKGCYNGHQIIEEKTLALMTQNQMPDNRDLAAMGQPVFSETPYDGIGFGLGFSVVLDPASAKISGSLGDFGWGGAASTYFWVDPVEKLIVVFMTQLLPSNAYQLRSELRDGVYLP